jgi:hypothetical protein
MSIPRETYDPAIYKNATRKGVTSRVFSSNIPHRAPVLCYIAGIECPIVSFSMSYGVWQIPEASITMFPDPLLQNFGKEDRVPVVVFYLDEYIDPANPTWRMLFDGEIVGWGYTNSAAGRTIRFDCVADISIYTQLFFFYMSTISGITQGSAEQPYRPEGANFVAPIFPYAIFKYGLVPDKEINSPVTRPYDIASNIVRGLTSDKIAPKVRSLPMYNFFARWVRKQQFHNKWVALPFLDEMYEDDGSGGMQRKSDQPPGIFPILRATQSQQALSAIEKVGEDYAGANVFTWLKMVLDTVYMELQMLPTPSAVGCLTNGHIDGPAQTLTFEDVKEKIAAKIRERAQSQFSVDLSGAPATLPTNLSEVPRPWLKDPTRPVRLSNYFVKPQMLFGLPPTCNVIFPSMGVQLNYSENYITQPTRLYLEDNVMINIITGGGNAEGFNNTLKHTLARGYPPPVDRLYRDKVEGLTPGLTGKNLLLFPEEFFKGPVTTRIQAPPWFFHYANLVNAQGPSVSAPSLKSVSPINGQELTSDDVYLLYAQYEYYRQRYAQRTGALQCAFQPYVVPGFPLVAFDSLQTRLHIVGYLMKVNQTITSEGLNTSLQYSYARTIYEFLEDIANEIDNPAQTKRKGLATASAPPEPIPEIRDIVQHEYKCDQFYQALFHQRLDKSTATKKKKTAVFRTRDVLSFVKSDGSLEPIFIEGKNEERIRTDKAHLQSAKSYLTSLKGRGPNDVTKRLATGTATSPEMQKFAKAVDIATEGDPSAFGGLQRVAIDAYAYADPYHAVIYSNEYDRLIVHVDTLLGNLDHPSTYHNLTNASQRELIPKPGFEPLFDSYDAAMQYCSRPICTLEEYILFIGRTPEGPQDDVAYKDGGKVPSARYYTRIRTLTGMDATTQVTDAQKGYIDNSEPKNDVDDNVTTGDASATSNVSSQNQPLFNIKAVEPGEAVPTSFPQMRAKWDEIILKYRRNVYAAVKIQR